MDEFPPFLLILIFIVVSLLEGAGRRRKAGQQGKPRPRPSPSEAPAGSPAGAGQPRPRPAAASGDASKTRSPSSSEGLIPAEVWEEILGLARGSPPGRPAPHTGPVPSPAPVDAARRGGEETDLRRRNETLEELPPFEARSLEEVPARPRERAAPQEDTGASTAPLRRPVAPSAAERARGAAVRVGPRAQARSPDRRPAPVPEEIGSSAPAPAQSSDARTDLFGSGSSEDLRRAVILKEVLGPPLALRE